MTLTTEYCGLVAQVFPTLVIALLLEARFARGNKWVAWINVGHHIVRSAAIIGALFSTFICLNIVGGKPASDAAGWIVGTSSFALMCAFAFMAGNVLGQENSEVVQILREKREKAAEER